MSIENPIFRSLEIIENRVNEKLTVENIAADVYISKYHYMRLFREIVGETVMNYVIKRKLTLAAKALRETDASILDIALDYGYESRDGFSRSFKAYMGVAPAEYRKLGQGFIMQTTGKRSKDMEYTKTADAVIRELNDWIVQASDLAVQVRKAERQSLTSFWIGVAEQTDALINNIQAVLNRVNSTAHTPDEITDGMEIAKVIDDTAFVIQFISIQIAMMEAKMPKQAEDIAFAEKYYDLAWTGAKKAEKIIVFFRELLLSVVKDMRETAAKKIQDAILKGQNAAAGIPENLGYIKDEIMQLVNELSMTPVESMTMLLLEDSFFKAKLITITAKLNIDTAYSALFEDMRIFTDALSDAVSFCHTITIPKEEPSLEQKKLKLMQDIVFLKNVLFFITKGEIDGLCAELSEAESQVVKSAFDDIKTKINGFIKIGLKAEHETSDVSMFHEIADKSYKITHALNCEADKSGLRGSALKVIANEQERLADKLLKCFNEINA